MSVDAAFFMEVEGSGVFWGRGPDADLAASEMEAAGRAVRPRAEVETHWDDGR